MLRLTALSGFAATTAGPDVTPDPFSWPDMNSNGFIASAMTPPVVIAGLSIPIVVRASVSTPLSPARTLTLLRDGAPVSVTTAGTTAELTIANGQALQVELANAADLSLWAGTLLLTNLSDAGATLATCAFSLLDTGSGGGGGGGGGEGGGDLP
jgi:hypothetical protein